MSPVVSPPTEELSWWYSENCWADKFLETLKSLLPDLQKQVPRPACSEPMNLCPSVEYLCGEMVAGLCLEMFWSWLTDSWNKNIVNQCRPLSMCVHLSTGYCVMITLLLQLHWNLDPTDSFKNSFKLACIWVWTCLKIVFWLLLGCMSNITKYNWSWWGHTSEEVIWVGRLWRCTSPPQWK